MDSDFDNYLTKKKINFSVFKTTEPILYARFKEAFMLMHEDSFTAQKLYFLNKLRRKYKN
jgi:hypothetical protein